MSFGEMAIQASSIAILVREERRRVLQSLLERRCTAAEVGRIAGLRRGGAQRVLLAFVKQGLVERHVDERKWVYYSLTPAGRHLIANERPILALLWSSLLALAGSSGAYLAWRVWYVKRTQAGAWGMNYVNLAEKSELWTPPTVAAAVVLVVSLAGAVWLIAQGLRRSRGSAMAAHDAEG
jgi:DNA-binding MarR family transcriptional regulator